MAQQRLGIIMNGVTGRMGMNQHLIRSIVAIRSEGGVALANGDRVMPDPILVGRNAEKVAALAKAHGITRWTTDLDAALKDENDILFFDAATTQLRAGLLQKLGLWAIAAVSPEALADLLSIRSPRERAEAERELIGRTSASLGRDLAER